MKTLLSILLGFMCFFPQMTGHAAAPSAEKVETLDICNLYGSVYIERVAAFAQYRVYVNDIESFADLVVFKQDNRAFADRPGFWHFTETKAFADFVIYVEEVEGFADFSISYTDFQTAAGCN